MVDATDERRRRAARLVASCDADRELLEWLRGRWQRRLAAAVSPDHDPAAAEGLRTVELALALVPRCAVVPEPLIDASTRQRAMAGPDG